MSISNYLANLVELKNQLVANLKSMGVTADESEKLNTLVPKVLECKTEQNVEWVDNPSGTLDIYDMVKKIVIPQGITVISDMAFENNKNLTEVIIPNSVTSIGSAAFRYCTSLESITLSDSMTKIESDTFNGCTALKNITLPNNITSLVTSTYSYGCFYNCTSLESITIGNKITSIGKTTFYGCNNLAHIYYTGTEEQWDAITKATGWNTNMGSNVTGGTTIHYNYVPE